MTALDALRPLARLRADEYRARLYERKAAERLLQEAIEAALDINAHLIAELGREVPEDYYGGFIKLGDLGILTPWPLIGRALAAVARLGAPDRFAGIARRAPFHLIACFSR